MGQAQRIIRRLGRVNPSLRVYVFSALVLVGLCIPIVWGPVRQLDRAATLLAIPWYALIPLFVVNDAYPVQVRTGRHQKTFGLAEIPLALGLLFCAPLGLVAARVIGGVVAMSLRGRRSTLMKGVFNSVMFLCEAGVALVVHRAVLGTADVLGPAGWFAVLIAVAATTALNVALLRTAMAIYDGRFLDRQDLGQDVLLSLFSAVLCASVGVAAALALAYDPRSVVVLAIVGGVIAVANKGYNALLARHENVELLHELTVVLGESVDQRTVMSAVAHTCARLVQARTNELHLLAEDEGPGEATIVVRNDEEGRRARDERAILISAAARYPRGRLLSDAADVDGTGHAALELLGERDGMLMPFEVEGLRGVLVAAGRPDGSRRFSAFDLKLLEMVASYAAGSLEKGMLIERLRSEALSKEHQSLHDALTGLPNRTLFANRVDRALAHAPPGRHVAVMLCDLDRFKEVNDTLGHHTGDQLLQAIGSRLVATLRPQDTVARLGGDEFAILMPDICAESEALATAERVREAIEAPAAVGDMTLFVGGSIGIALAPLHGEDTASLLQRADIAMYTAKAGRHGVQVYAAEHDLHSHDRLALVGELRHAIERGELVVHYQPKADVRTASIVGAEALVRWQHPERGFISPDDFIPIAERTGLIRPLTELVLRDALSRCARWQEDGLDLAIAVNLSVESLVDSNLPADVGRMLREAGVDASRLTLEITESMIMADVERAISVLTELQAMGVGISVDDFGTGYSSLFQLKRLPVTELKIDRSFVRDMTTDENDALIVRSTIELGHNLGLRVVAEGVEDRATWEVLASQRCDGIQGYFMSPALPPQDLAEWVATWRSTMQGTLAVPATRGRAALMAR